MESESGGEMAGMAPDLARRMSSMLDAVEREADRLMEEARVQAEQQVELARRQADGLVAERQRRISELSDELIERTESLLERLDETAPIRDSFNHLLQSLSHAADRLAFEIESDDGGRRAAPATAAPAPEPPPPPPPRAEPESPPRSVEEPTRVRHLRPSLEPSGVRPPAPAAEGEAAAAGGWGWATPPGQDPQLVQRARQAAIQMAAAGTTRSQVASYLRGSLGIDEPDPLLDEIFGAGTADDARVPWAASS